MRKYLWLLILLTPFLFAGSIQHQQMAIIGQYNAAAASDSADFTEDMTGTFADDWSMAAGTAEYASDQWDPTGVLDNAGVYKTGDTNSIKHWDKVTLVNGDDGDDASGVLLRAVDISATGDSYAVVCEVTASELKIYRLDAGAWQEDSAETPAHTCADGEVLAASVESTGATTVIRVWIDPTGAADSGPSAWGAATNAWNQSTGDLNFDSYADTGEFIGVYNYDNENILDTWYGGDW